jgi:hypothetical protein
MVKWRYRWMRLVSLGMTVAAFAVASGATHKWA